MGRRVLLALLLGGVIVVFAAGAQAAQEPKNAPSAQPTSQLQQGREVFIQFCAACHGESGNGKPASGLKLKPPALDLTAYELSESFIRKVLQEGVLGTGMAAWQSLPADQLSAVTAYTATLAHPDQLSPQARMAQDDALREGGRRVYVVHCARCHGNDGKGDGPDSSLLKPPAADFTGMRPSYPAGARAIAEGVPGSAMQAWPLLTGAEIQAVTFYIRLFYRGTEQDPKAQPR